MAFQMEVVDENGESLGLPDHFLKIPLTALRVSVRRVISLYLDEPSDIVDEESGYVNDYNGLAECIGFSYLEIKHFGRQKSPTAELIEQWETRDNLEKDPTIGALWESLCLLGRFDVMKDCQLAIVKDVEAYLRNREREEQMIKPVQSNDVTQSTDHFVNEKAILCKGDVDYNTPQYFDAFVCYNHEGNDLEFVKNMIRILEGDGHKLKLFIPGRDDLPGASKYTIDAKLIESRCRRMVIILSPNYLQSSACDFQSKFAHALSPGARSKKLIPVLIEQIKEIPQILRHVTLCDYTKVDLQEWFWNRLSSAIKQPLDPVSSGWGQGSQESVSNSGSYSSSPSDSAIGSSIASSVSNIKMEISSDSYDSLKAEWVDLSDDFSHEAEMSDSHSCTSSLSSSFPPNESVVPSATGNKMSSSLGQTTSGFSASKVPHQRQRAKGDFNSSTAPVMKGKSIKTKLRQGFERFTALSKGNSS